MSDSVIIFTGGTGGHVLPSVSFGNYLIEKIEVNNCGDKGLSVGETSVVKMKNLVSKNAKIGLASKDYSKVFSQSIQAYDTETCISAYKKKKEFSGGLISVEKLDCQNHIHKYQVDKFSKVIFKDYEL